MEFTVAGARLLGHCACTSRGIAQFIDLGRIRAYLLSFVVQRFFLAWMVSVTCPEWENPPFAAMPGDAQSLADGGTSRAIAI